MRLFDWILNIFACFVYVLWYHQYIGRKIKLLEINYLSLVSITGNWS